MGCFDNLKKHVQDHREDLGTHQCVPERDTNWVALQFVFVQWLSPN